MKVIGYCQRCRHFRYVSTPTMLYGGVVFGICGPCETEES